ncbi:arsenate reductase [Roseibacterium sp. SDUM158016]|jgi:arsenate reductase-like glutaredoxin family protein|uniref:arsenate reductase family protein n=1 Tax=Roseicyclus sediminis TaxID=2980997 RepID=UPI0021D1A78F|nr:ArsC/Spx/MgsR family protein [Roseibacterium sp. SDUM158016]MCU4654884.1 arsenate reductase [Roseibacterium sp. SDUM158016]
MTLYGLKACDTCRKALKALREAGHEAELVDVRETPVGDAVLDRFLGAFGEALVNTRSTTWRGLSEDERGLPARTLLAAHPALMKRPVIEADGTLYLGWDAGVRSALL